MRVQRLLDLARVDVVAAADDQLLLAVDEEQIALFVEAADIAGRQPAVGVDRVARRFVIVPVAGDHGRPAELDLADAVLVRAGDPQFGPAERHPDRARLARLPEGVSRRDPAELREAVALVDLAAERPL